MGLQHPDSGMRTSTPLFIQQNGFTRFSHFCWDQDTCFVVSVKGPPALAFWAHK